MEGPDTGNFPFMPLTRQKKKEFGGEALAPYLVGDAALGKKRSQHFLQRTLAHRSPSGHKQRPVRKKKKLACRSHAKNKELVW